MYKKVSIMLPALNREKTIAEAIESIINQTFEDWKIVALDDGSTDGTLKILESYEKDLGDKLQIILHKERMGLPKTINDIIEKCNTEFVTWVSSDDFFYKNKLETDISFMEKCDDVDITWSSFDVIDIQGKILYRACNSFPESLIEEQMPKHFEISWASICFRKATTFDILKKVDGFVADEIFKTTADWDINIRLSKFCKFAYINKPLSVWRTHPNQGTYSEEHKRDNILLRKRIGDGFYRNDRYKKFRRNFYE